MLALIVTVSVLTASLLRKDLMGLDTSDPVDTVLHDILKFGDDDDTGVTIKGLPPLVEDPTPPAPPVPSNTEDSEGLDPSPSEAPPF